MKLLSVVVVVVAIGCSGERPEWGCCEAYPVLSSEPAPDGAGTLLRVQDCDGVREFTCLHPAGVDLSEHPEAMVCHDDAGAPVPFWKSDRGCW
jgi:hypothetical protein